MTIATTVSSVTAYGNGVTTSFNYNFLIPQRGQEQITIVDPYGNATVLTSGQYIITGFGSVNGGTVTYPLSGAPLATGWTITIARILPLIQNTSLSNQGAFYPSAVEVQLDYLTMLIQQIANATLRAISTPVTDPNLPAVLPPAATRANLLLGFDNLGNPTAVSFQSSGTLVVSAAMQPVLAAATAAAALAIMNGVSQGRNINTSGLLTGGGNLSTDLNLAVPIASGSDVSAGTSNTKAVTPAALATAAFVPQSTTISTTGLLTGGGNLSANRTFNVQAASSGDISTGTDNTRAVTSLAIAGANIATFDSSSNQNLTNFPIGSILLASNESSTNVSRNQSVSVYYNNSKSQLFSITGGTVISGTWRARGQTAQIGSCLCNPPPCLQGFGAILVQRTA